MKLVLEIVPRNDRDYSPSPETQRCLHSGFLLALPELERLGVQVVTFRQKPGMIAAFDMVIELYEKEIRRTGVGLPVEAEGLTLEEIVKNGLLRAARATVEKTRTELKLQADSLSARLENGA